MRLVSTVVGTGDMCDLDGQRAKMAVVSQHIPRFLVSLPTVRMFRVVADQLRLVRRSGAKASSMRINVFADGIFFTALSHQLRRVTPGSVKALSKIFNVVADEVRCSKSSPTN